MVYEFMKGHSCGLKRSPLRLVPSLLVSIIRTILLAQHGSATILQYTDIEAALRRKYVVPLHKNHLCKWKQLSLMTGDSPVEY